MKVIAPIRQKRKMAPGAAPEEPESAPNPPEPQRQGNTGQPPRSPPGGLVRKSAIRRFLKQEFDFPLQLREAFFVAIEAKFSEDLRRSVARARELKRNTLMAPDA